MFSDRSSKIITSESSSKHRILAHQDDDEQNDSKTGHTSRGFCGTLLNIFLAISLLNTLLAVIIYFAPMQEPQIEPKVSPYRPRPKLEGPLGMNEQLDHAEILFEGQFHAPESLAWRRTTNRTFFTGVEGGFILEVNPFTRQWTQVAQLNSPLSDVIDESHKSISIEASSIRTNPKMSQDGPLRVEYCDKDVQLYGEEAKSQPKVVTLSRCSRPLGLRLSPDESYLYVIDPFSGLYRINLNNGGGAQTTRLIEFGALNIQFADDLAVKWGPASASGADDKIYFSDCSRKWTLRYLIRMMIEYDDSGRILEFDVGTRIVKPLASANADGSLRPAKLMNENGQVEDDWRNLSFPNGVELMANSSALLISDLNNRRILVHHLEGPLRGETRHLLWVPGYSDNIKRGLDTLEGRPTYWLACGCAVSDENFQPAELLNQFPLMAKLLLKLSHYVGYSIEWLGHHMGAAWTENFGLEIRSLWLKKDPFCTHGLVMQFDETGQVLRTLHAPHFSSSLKIVSEAHEVPDSEQPSSISHLFIGSVYYSYLGHLELKML